MTPVGKMNPATSKENTEARTDRESQSQATGAGANKENSALSRRPADEYKKFGSDAEFAKEEDESEESDEDDYGFSDRAQDMAQSAMHKVQEFSGTALKQSGSFIRRYPAQTILVGFGLGVVFGMTLLNRR